MAALQEVTGWGHHRPMRERAWTTKTWAPGKRRRATGIARGCGKAHSASLPGIVAGRGNGHVGRVRIARARGYRSDDTDALLIPPGGFDARGYRLGYGRGYFDRTLAALRNRPLRIAVAYELSRVETIRPQPHDIAMDYIVTEAGIHRVGERGLTLLERANAPVRAAP